MQLLPLLAAGILASSVSAQTWLSVSQGDSNQTPGGQIDLAQPAADLLAHVNSTKNYDVATPGQFATSFSFPTDLTAATMRIQLVPIAPAAFYSNILLNFRNGNFEYSAGAGWLMEEMTGNANIQVGETVVMDIDLANIPRQVFGLGSFSAIGGINVGNNFDVYVPVGFMVDYIKIQYQETTRACLSISGDYPGPTTYTVTGATPGNDYLLLYSSFMGDFPFIYGNQNFTVQVAPMIWSEMGTADANGNLFFTGFSGPDLYTSDYFLQALDLDSGMGSSILTL